MHCSLVFSTWSGSITLCIKFSFLARAAQVERSQQSPSTPCTARLHCTAPPPRTAPVSRPACWCRLRRGAGAPPAGWAAPSCSPPTPRPAAHCRTARSRPRGTAGPPTARPGLQPGQGTAEAAGAPPTCTGGQDGRTGLQPEVPAAGLHLPAQLRRRLLPGGGLHLALVPHLNPDSVSVRIKLCHTDH